ncbi:MAG: C40 family peptidase [Synergistaceae bacterium]|jgi:beta-lactamase class A|nr:C40 family peptidase [Synergistaceae bacterium]
MNEIIFTEPMTPLMLRPESGEMTDEALCGMAASITGEERGMLRVRMRYRYEGYVEPGRVRRVESAADWESLAGHRVIAPTADVMSEPLYESAMLATLPRGAMFAAGNESDAAPGWLPATLAGGGRGYIRSVSVRPARKWEGPEATLRANVISDAKLYLGAQYRWGGKSHCGLDCSGLVGASYMLNGLYLYRDAKIVAGYPVREIPADRAKPADPMFWDGHVGLYLGEGLYIHSTQRSSGVVINSLNPSDANFREDLATVKQWGSVFD